VPRRARFTAQVAVALGGLVAALGCTIWVAFDMVGAEGDVTARGQVAAEGALAIDGPSVFLWGLLLLFGLTAMMLFSERRVEGGLTAFTGQAASPPGSAGESEAITKKVEHTEVFPLAAF